MKQMCRLLLLSVSALLISACGWWGGEEEAQPAELVSFEAEKKVNVLWSVSVGSGVGESYSELTPAVVGESIYVTDIAGKVSAYDRASGKLKWSVDLDTEILGGVGAGLNHVAVSNREGEIIVLAADSGAEQWRQQLTSETLSPSQMNQNILVAQLQNGKLVAFDIETGERRWTYDSQIPRLTLRGTSAPLVASNVTIAGFANGKLVAVNNDNGSEIWQRQVAVPQGKTELERLVDIDARPLFKDGVIYIASYQGRLVAIGARDAQVLWGQDVSTYQSLAEGFGNIYVSEANGYVQAFDQRSSASVWRQNALELRQTSAPVAVGNSVVVSDYEGYLHFMSQIDGHFIARYQVDSAGVNGDMEVVDDVLYVLGNSGRLYALQLD